jgi:2-(1,2-epoxy-1,2-dihydrophenyl)acetyl-CoA isomerase
MEYRAIVFEIDRGVARITLNRPDVANALNLEMAQDLFHASLRCDEDASVRAVLLTGAGRAFCAGGDLRDFSHRGDDTARFLKEITTYLHGAISRFSRSNKPLIAGVNGVAAGAGFSMVLACDLAVSAASARYTMAYTKAGLTPDGSSTYFLPRIAGLRRAIELTLTNRVLSAAEALEWGLLNRVVDDATLPAEAMKLAEELASGPTLAFGRTKNLFRVTWGESLESQMENETQAIADSSRTSDYREGSTAFLEKRSPVFTGE